MILGIDPIVGIEIQNPFNEKDFRADKLTILDIKARDQAGRILHVEVQILLPRHFSPRVLYYWASGYRRSDELRDDLDKWAYFLRHAETLDADVLPEPLREPAYQHAAKELETLPRAAHRYTRRL